MLARALSDLEFCKCLDPVKEEICDVDLHFFFFLVLKQSLIVSIQSPFAAASVRIAVHGALMASPCQGRLKGITSFH